MLRAPERVEHERRVCASLVNAAEQRERVRVVIEHNVVDAIRGPPRMKSCSDYMVQRNATCLRVHVCARITLWHRRMQDDTYSRSETNA